MKIGKKISLWSIGLLCGLAIVCTSASVIMNLSAAPVKYSVVMPVQGSSSAKSLSETDIKDRLEMGWVFYAMVNGEKQEYNDDSETIAKFIERHSGWGNEGVKFYLEPLDSVGETGGEQPNPVTYYTVTYDANNATSGSVPIDSTHYSSGAAVTVLGNTGNLARTNYTFAGWNTKADGSGTTYNVNSENKTFTITQDTTLYAQWQIITYSLSFDSSAGKESVLGYSYSVSDNSGTVSAGTVNSGTKLVFTFTYYPKTTPDDTSITFGEIKINGLIITKVETAENETSESYTQLSNPVITDNSIVNVDGYRKVRITGTVNSGISVGGSISQNSNDNSSTWGSFTVSHKRPTVTVKYNKQVGDDVILAYSITYEYIGNNNCSVKTIYIENAKTSVVIPEEVEFNSGVNYSVTTIQSSVLSNLTDAQKGYITSLETPETVRTISASAFFGCNNLATIKLGAEDADNINISIGSSAFGSWDAPVVSRIVYISSANILSNITLPENLGSLLNYGNLLLNCQTLYVASSLFDGDNSTILTSRLQNLEFKSTGSVVDDFNKYTKSKIITVDFMLNDYDFEEFITGIDCPWQVQINAGATLDFAKIPVVKNNDTSKNYIFVGWFDAEKDGTQINENTKFYNDIILYPHWVETATSHTVTLNHNNNGDSSTTGQFTVYENCVYGLLPTPTRAGYDFTGWFDAETNGDQVFNNSLTDNAITTLYAHWTPKTLTITLKQFDATTTVSPTAPATITYLGTSMSVTASPTRTGFTFAGWFTSRTDGSKVIETDGKVVSGSVDGYVQGGKWIRTTNTTLFAQWIENSQT